MSSRWVWVSGVYDVNADRDGGERKGLLVGLVDFDDDGGGRIQLASEFFC